MDSSDSMVEMLLLNGADFLRKVGRVTVYVDSVAHHMHMGTSISISRALFVLLTRHHVLNGTQLQGPRGHASAALGRQQSQRQVSLII